VSPLGCFYLNCAPKNACNEKGIATKEDFQFKIFIKTHPMGGLVFLSMLDEDRGSKAFFRCGSPFVAKFRFYPLGKFCFIHLSV
jgi:hypothetical protein